MFKLLKMTISLIFFQLCLWSLVGVFGADEVKLVSVMEGDSVTLHTNVTEIQNPIKWRFGHNNILIGQINIQNNKSTFYDGSANGRFIGRLQLDQAGSLTITNTRTTDSGLYKVTSTESVTQFNIFNLIVCDCRCCGFTEAVIQLVLSALVGMAGVVILVYEFRTRNLLQKKSVRTTATNTDPSDVDFLVTYSLAHSSHEVS